MSESLENGPAEGARSGLSARAEPLLRPKSGQRAGPAPQIRPKERPQPVIEVLPREAAATPDISETSHKQKADPSGKRGPSAELPEIRALETGQPWGKLTTALEDYAAKRSVFYTARKADSTAPEANKRLVESFRAARKAFNKVTVQAYTRGLFVWNRKVGGELRAQLKDARKVIAAADKLLASRKQEQMPRTAAMPRNSGGSAVSAIAFGDAGVPLSRTPSAVSSLQFAPLSAPQPSAAATPAVAAPVSSRPVGAATEQETLNMLLRQNQALLAHLESSSSTPAPGTVESRPQRRAGSSDNAGAPAAVPIAPVATAVAQGQPAMSAQIKQRR